MAQGSKEKNKKNEVLERARKHLALHLADDSDIRKNFSEDLEFRSGCQWPKEVEEQRRRDQRPCLTINKIPGYVNQITNDLRQNRPAIAVHPVDSEADPIVAEVLQGLIRHIEYNSHADVAYDTAVEHAAIGGRGFWWLTADYCDPYSFDQEPLIKQIENPLNVAVPRYTEPDGSDMSWGMVYEDLSEAEYNATYGKGPGGEDWGSKSAEWGSLSPEELGQWKSEETIRVANYYEKEFKKSTIYRIDPEIFQDIAIPEELYGKVFEESELPEIFNTDEIKSALKASGNTRETLIPEIKHYKICGVGIIDETVWPGKYIPIVPVHGAKLVINGKTTFEGIVRHSKDSQRMYNFMASAEAEAIGLAPKAPWVGAEGQFEGHEAKWNSAHVKNYSYLEYKPTLLANNEYAPPPQRQFGEPQVQAINQARMMSSEDMKATTNMYDAAMGRQSNETSGRAIRARTMQAQTNNFHFSDNLVRSIRHTGRILVDIIPYYYDAPRTIRTIGKEEEQKVYRVFDEIQSKGKTKRLDFSVGKYDVTCTAGPSYSSKRQEAAEMMMQFTQSMPQLLQVAGDLIMKNMDIPGADQLAERLKKTLPPGLAEDDENQEIPPQAKAAMDQMQLAIQQLGQQLQALEEEKRTKLVELESKERIEQEKIAADLQKAQMSAEVEMAKLGSVEAIDNLRFQISQIEQVQAQMSEFFQTLNQNSQAGLPDQQFVPAPNLPDDAVSVGTPNMEEPWQ